MHVAATASSASESNVPQDALQLCTRRVDVANLDGWPARLRKTSGARKKFSRAASQSKGGEPTAGLDAGASRTPRSLAAYSC